MFLEKFKIDRILIDDCFPNEFQISVLITFFRKKKRRNFFSTLPPLHELAKK